MTNVQWLNIYTTPDVDARLSALLMTCHYAVVDAGCGWLAGTPGGVAMVNHPHGVPPVSDQAASYPRTTPAGLRNAMPRRDTARIHLPSCFTLSNRSTLVP